MPVSANTDICPCHFCGSGAHPSSDVLSMWIECSLCLARGPAVMKDRPDAYAQMIAGWSAGKKFGRIAVANVPGGMPAFTCSLAERIRLMVEGIYRGDFGSPDGGVVILRAGNQVTVSPHNVSAGDVTRVLDAARSASRVRAATLPPRRH